MKIPLSWLTEDWWITGKTAVVLKVGSTAQSELLRQRLHLCVPLKRELVILSTSLQCYSLVYQGRKAPTTCSASVREVNKTTTWKGHCSHKKKDLVPRSYHSDFPSCITQNISLKVRLSTDTFPWMNRDKGWMSHPTRWFLMYAVT